MIRRDLVFDLGMHRGEDTAFYLAKGLRVVGFEADPALAELCRTRFAGAIRAGNVEIIEGAIAPHSSSGRIAFYRNPKKTVWGTIDSDWVERNKKFGRNAIRIEVPVVDLSAAFQAHGIPHYIKIDIEGADHAVLDALRALPERPRFLSIESEKMSFARLEAELRLLRSLGYTRFAAVQQADIGQSRVIVRDLEGNEVEFEFEEGASGVFGDDIAEWRSFEECLRQYRTIFKLYRWFGDQPLIAMVPGGRLVRSVTRRWIVRGPLPGWYDTHASME